MPDVNSDSAAAAVLRACRTKFPTNSQPATEPNNPTKIKRYTIETMSSEWVTNAFGFRVFRVLIFNDRDVTITAPTIFAKAEACGPSRDEVRNAQVRLNSLGFDSGSPDGNIGPRTRRALEDFQRSKSIPVTGELDFSTAKSLNIRLFTPDLFPPVSHSTITIEPGRSAYADFYGLDSFRRFCFTVGQEFRIPASN